MSNNQKVSIRSLQIFECVARTGSTIKAAEELSVTQSAISHQMKQLALALGEQLFERNGRSLKLTERGAELGRELTSAFANIGESVNSIIRSNRNRVRLAVCSSFGAGWLAPRMAAFLAQNPDIDLDVLQFGNDPDLTDAVADAYVTAKAVVSGFQAIDLFEERLVAVASPAVATLFQFPAERVLISTTAGEPMRASDWHNFVQYTGLNPGTGNGERWLFCSHFVTALAFAEAGAGAALVPDFLAREALAAGRLVRVAAGSMATGRTYRFCVKGSRKSEAPLSALSKWVSSGAHTRVQLVAE